jgi:cytidylate kinase
MNVMDIVTIDGPSGSGKSTVSRIIAERLGYRYLDTGAIYRAVAWKAREEGVDPEDDEGLRRVLDTIDISFEGKKIIVNGVDVTFLIREPKISELSSRVSSRRVVRDGLYEMQRSIGLKGKVVVEGRDIGSTVLPEAGNKFFLDADVQERGRRRYKEIRNNGADIDLRDIVEALQKRDRRDSSRQNSPLKKTEEMIYINTSNLTIEEVVSRVMGAIKTG